MRNKVLIFGVNGFVGPYLAREFEQNGYEVLGSDRARDTSLKAVSEYHASDLMDEDGVQKVISEVSPNLIVNLAAVSSVRESWKMPQTTVATNVVGSLNILEGAKRLSIPPRVLLIGSSEEYAPSLKPLSEESELDATNPYGISKVTQERFAKLYQEQFGIPVYMVRAFNHTGWGQNHAFAIPSWCKQVAEIDHSGRGGIIKVGNTDVVRDFSDVRDIVRGYRLVIESGYAGEVFNLGSGRACDLSHLLDIICSFSSQDVRIKQDESLMRPTDNPFVVCDHGKATRLLGWNVEFPIEETLKDMFLHFMRVSAS